MTRMDRLVLVAGVVCGVLFWTTMDWYWGTLCFVLLVVVLPWPELDESQ